MRHSVPASRGGPRQRRGAPKDLAQGGLQGREYSIPEDPDGCWRIFEDARTFDNAPYFNRDDAKLKFDTNSAAFANGNYGTVFVLR